MPRFVAVVCILSCARVGFAAPPEPPTPAQELAAKKAAEAEALFLQGRAAMKKGDWAGACVAFEASAAIEVTGGTLLNLALCEEQLGRLLRAIQHARAALERLPKDATDRRAVAQDVIDRTSPKLARLVIPMSVVPAESVVRLDGEVVASFGAPIELEPGIHVLEVISADKKRTRSIKLSASTQLAFEGWPSTSAPPPRPSTPVDPPATSSRVVWSTSLIVLGATGLAVGAASGVVALRAASDVRTHCPDRVCDDDGLAARDRGRTWATVSTLAFVVGVTSLGAGAYLRWSAPAGPQLSASLAPGRLEANLLVRF